MKMETICDLLIDKLREAQYKESTIFNYQGEIRRFKEFCREHDVTDYSCSIGKLYVEDVISPLTGKFSKERYFMHGRLIRLLDSYVNTGQFDLSTAARTRLRLSTDIYCRAYAEFCEYLKVSYENQNTRHFYEYGMYSFLSFLEVNNYQISLTEITPSIIIDYLKQSKPFRKREVLCELRKICRYLNRKDLSLALEGIHARRHQQIIPFLKDCEQEKLKAVIEDGSTPLRDSAMILLGLSTGIRACDIIKLRLSDIDWKSETITWKQSKTGHPVCLPLTPAVGNAIARYLTEQRPKAPNDFLFVRLIAPFDPLSDHASCYVIVKRALDKAGICKDDRIFGMHMLRHNAASTMVRNSVPVETIAAVLGHSDPDTTGIYITTDEKVLKQCVLPFKSISKEVHA